VPINQDDAETVYDHLEVAAKGFIHSPEVLILPEEEKILTSTISRWEEKGLGAPDGITDFRIAGLVDSTARTSLHARCRGLHCAYLRYDGNLNR